MQLDVQDYWNKVERAVRSSGKGHHIVDNFDKRRVLVEALLKYPLQDAKIVELGTGLGLTAHVLGLTNGRLAYTGVDISQTFADAAKKHFGLSVVVKDVTDGLPFADGVANALFAFDVLEHIAPEHREKLWGEIDRILDKKERIIFINNPLDESGHNEKYDFGLDETDIAKLAVATGTRIVEVKILQPENRHYQFIVLAKAWPG